MNKSSTNLPSRFVGEQMHMWVDERGNKLGREKGKRVLFCFGFPVFGTLLVLPLSGFLYSIVLFPLTPFLEEEIEDDIMLQ